MSKATSTPLVAPGGTVNYTITVGNGGNIPATLTSITDTLPAGFTYVSGSTTGVTTSDPGISGQDLTWSGSFNVPAAGNVTLQFSATASSTPGDYLNNAGGTADNAPVSPSGPTAEVTVQGAPPDCGNGMTEQGETCDDGNTDSCDGCSATCQTESCGDTVTCPGETCDDGNTDSCDGCSATCQTETCGDGVTCAGQGEQCDPPGPSCSASCQTIACGNGMVDPGESCDPPGSPQGPNQTACRADCTFCGDTVVQSGETCDDGNTDDGCPSRADNCRNDCSVPICKIPARIRFNAPYPDEFKAHGRIHPSPSFDPSSSGVRMRLENSSGVIFSTIVPPTKVRDMAGIVYRAYDGDARAKGGVAYLRVIKRRNRASNIIFRYYGDLSAATDPHMKLTITMGDEEFTVAGEWRELSDGWWLPDVRWE